MSEKSDALKQKLIQEFRKRNREGHVSSTFNADQSTLASEVETLRHQRAKIREDEAFRKWRESEQL